MFGRSQIGLREGRRVGIIFQFNRPSKMLRQVGDEGHVFEAVNIRGEEDLGACPVVCSRDPDSYFHLARFRVGFLEQPDLAHDGIEDTAPAFDRGGDSGFLQELFTLQHPECDLCCANIHSDRGSHTSPSKPVLRHGIQQSTIDRKSRTPACARPV